MVNEIYCKNQFLQTPQDVTQFSFPSGILSDLILKIFFSLFRFVKLNLKQSNENTMTDQALVHNG